MRVQVEIKYYVALKQYQVHFFDESTYVSAFIWVDTLSGSIGNWFVMLDPYVIRVREAM